MSISVHGVQLHLKAMKERARRDGVKIADGLRQAGQMLFNKSQELVPVNTGMLKASAKLVVKGVGFGATATVSYDTEYAIFVHEDLTKYHAPPTQARFLAEAAKKVKGPMTRILARRLKVL